MEQVRSRRRWSGLACGKVARAKGVACNSKRRGEQELEVGVLSVVRRITHTKSRHPKVRAHPHSKTFAELCAVLGRPIKGSHDDSNREYTWRWHQAGRPGGNGSSIRLDVLTEGDSQGA